MNLAPARFRNLLRKPGEMQRHYLTLRLPLCFRHSLGVSIEGHAGRCVPSSSCMTLMSAPMAQQGRIRVQRSQRAAAFRAILVSNSTFSVEARMHDLPHSRWIRSSDTAAIWLLGFAFTAVHFVA